MHRFRFALLVAASGLLTLAPSPAADEPPAAERQTAEQVESKGPGGKSVTTHYWLALPPASAEKPAAGWPLLVFLHGSGERGTDLKLVRKHGPPALVGKEKALDSFIVASPQCPAGRWWDVREIRALVDHLCETRPVDRNRIILTGLSMGGFGTWTFLAEYPDLLAAAVPICGGGDPATAPRFKHVPIRCYHGAKDKAVPQSASDAMIEALRKAGASPDYTIYPDEGHESWIPAYKDASLYEWMLRQQRKP